MINKRVPAGPQRSHNCSADLGAVSSVAESSGVESSPHHGNSQGSWHALCAPLRCALCGGEVPHPSSSPGAAAPAAPSASTTLPDCSPALAAAAHATRATPCSCSHYSWSAETTGLQFLGEVGAARRHAVPGVPAYSNAAIPSRASCGGEAAMHGRKTTRPRHLPDVRPPSPLRQLASNSTSNGSAHSTAGASCRTTSARAAWERKMRAKHDAGDAAAQHAAQTAGQGSGGAHPRRESFSRICFSRAVRGGSNRRKVPVTAAP